MHLTAKAVITVARNKKIIEQSELNYHKFLTTHLQVTHTTNTYTMIDVKFVTTINEAQKDGTQKQVFLDELNSSQVLNMITRRSADEYTEFRGGFAISQNEKPWNVPRRKKEATYLYDDLHHTAQWLTALSEVIDYEEHETSFSWLDKDATRLEIDKKNRLTIEHKSSSNKLRALKVDAKEFVAKVLQSSKKLNKFIRDLDNRISMKTAESPHNPVTKRLLDVQQKLTSLKLTDKIKQLERSVRKL